MFVKWLGYVRDRVVGREIRMGDGQKYKGQKWMIEHPLKRNQSRERNGNGEPSIFWGQEDPNFWLLILGLMIGGAAIKYGVAVLFGVLFWSSAFLIPSLLFGRYMSRKMAEKKLEKQDKDIATEPNFEEMDDSVDLEI